jgi:scyllo-inositol 2-dehydrogenase (NADP+)
LFGTPTTIWADLRTSRDHAVVDDAFDILLTFEKTPGLDRLRVWLCATLTAASPGARFTLHGTRGSYEKWGLDPQEDALRSGDTFSTPGFGTEASTHWGILTLPGTPPEPVPTARGDYRAYYANVRDAILGKAPLIVTIADAWRVARLIELARDSMNAGCRLPVDLSAAPS